MYLNLIQISESFGVSEKVVEDWVRKEGLPHTPDRGRLLFDRAQVATWAAARGLAAQAGFLAAGNPVVTAGWRLESLLRAGGIWRDVEPGAVAGVFEKIVAALPGATPPIRQLLGQRLRAPGGVVFAPVGGGFGLPHPGVRVALGRDSGVVALLLLCGPLELTEPVPDDAPITRLIFFIAPSPRAHLDLLGRLNRVFVGGPLRELIVSGAADDEIHQALAAAETGSREVKV
jgi:PTS system nitrogen regulatory IIA component